eukprot:gene569-615_t
MGTSRVAVGAEDEAKQRGYRYLKADPAQDLWALGCILYLLCTGSTLFQATVQDNMSDESDLEVLYNWSSLTKKNKLSSVADRHARHLISLLLTKEPCRRIPISDILNHPFLTRHVLHSSMKLHPCSSAHGVVDSNKESVAVAVTSGVAAIPNDIYLCYRYGCDEDVVKKLYTALIDNGLTVCGGFGYGIDGNTLGHAVTKDEDKSPSLDALVTSTSPTSADNSPVGNLMSLSSNEDYLVQTQILSNQGGFIEGEIEQALSTVVKSISVMASRQKIESIASGRHDGGTGMDDPIRPESMNILRDSIGEGMVGFGSGNGNSQLGTVSRKGRKGYSFDRNSSGKYAHTNSSRRITQSLSFSELGRSDSQTTFSIQRENVGDFSLDQRNDLSRDDGIEDCVDLVSSG